MSWTRRTWMMLAAATGFLSVAIGAFAAHGLTDPQSQEWLRTGATYAFMHALATFVCALLIELGALRARFAPAFFLSGALIFSGTLTAMAIGAPRWLGALTPVGGIFFLIGWAILAWAVQGLDRRA